MGACVCCVHVHAYACICMPASKDAFSVAPPMMFMHLQTTLLLHDVLHTALLSARFVPNLLVSAPTPSPGPGHPPCPSLPSCARAKSLSDLEPEQRAYIQYFQQYCACLLHTES